MGFAQQLSTSTGVYSLFDSLDGKVVLVTGCCGTVGSEIINQLLIASEYCPSEIIGVDNSESELFFQEQKYIGESKISFVMADMRDSRTVFQLFEGVDVVFHVAALKHVVLCERSPLEAVQTNILGVQNVVSAARSNGVSKVIFTSSDKAVNPTSVMGTSKLMGERLITAANSNMAKGNSVFASTRFGNVLGSNGSVIPIFLNQIKKVVPVTLTDDRMSRFIMTIAEAAKLVINSSFIAKGGEVMITKMPVINISDLAEVMIELLALDFGYDPKDIKIQSIGAKPGEKLYEELMSDEETRRAVELEGYFSVLPAYRGIYRDIDYKYPEVVSVEVTNPYNSDTEAKMSKSELKEFLVKNSLVVGNPTEPFDERYWPGDK